MTSTFILCFHFLRKYAADNNHMLIDLESAIPFSEDNGLWDDQLHFTDKGYDAVGEEIWKIFQKEIERN